MRTPRQIAEEAERAGGRPPNQPAMPQGGGGAPPEPAPATPTTATVTVQAEGAAPVTVEIKGEAAPEPTGTVKVVTIDFGTFDEHGIAPVGTEREIEIALFSKRWMRPAGTADEKKLKAAGKL